MLTLLLSLSLLTPGQAPAGRSPDGQSLAGPAGRLDGSDALQTWTRAIKNCSGDDAKLKTAYEKLITTYKQAVVAEVQLAQINARLNQRLPDDNGLARMRQDLRRQQGIAEQELHD